MEQKGAEAHSGKLTKGGYQVQVRGEIPADLHERVSALHAHCILKGLEKGPVAENQDQPDTGDI